MRMKAAVLRVQGLAKPYAESRPLSIEEVELDPPGEDEVLIEVAAAGLCHSDLSTIENLRPRKLPTIPGHEASGIVREVGAKVQGLKPGDHVVSVFVSACGECRWCGNGRPNLCPTSTASKAAGTLASGARRLRLAAEPINHYSGLSVFAEYAVVARNSLVKIDPDIPLETAAIFGCAVMTGAGAVFNTAKVTPGALVAVVGLGGVGMNAVLAARVAGAARIVAVDIQPAKLALAQELGATEGFLATDPGAVEAIRDATGGGLDIVIETAGSLKAMEFAYAITARGGSTVTAGLPDVSHRFALPLSAMVAEERSIRASYMGSCVASRDIPMLLDLWRRGRLPVERLVSGRIPLADINAGFDRLSEGGVLRQLLIPRL
ncbi:MAG TPA: zinc-dependent alcohol dehydrogenase family protein [Roseomonas sp.]